MAASQLDRRIHPHVLKVLAVLFLATLGLFLTRQVQRSRSTRLPRLVLVVVIDQFRADYLTRFRERIEKSGGGLKFLLEEGAVYPFAEYRLLQAMTAPGHATVLTGTYPYRTGIPANSWYDDDKRHDMSSVEDESARLIGSSGAIAGRTGASPRNLIANTLGDELKNAGYPGKVVSISLKDRSAVLMGGHRADLALWFDPDQFEWVSSQYYLPEGHLPGWVVKMNEVVAKRRGKELSWEAQGPGSGLSVPPSEIADDPWHTGAGKQFPHHLKAEGYGAMLMPFGAEITVTAAESALREYRLGQDETPDILAVSFSTHDLLGHLFSPNSREMEEMTLVMDRMIGRLLERIDQTIPGGLNSTLVALTGDHGAPPNPEWLVRKHHPAGRIDQAELKKVVESSLTKRFGKRSWVAHISSFSLFFSEQELKSAGIQGEKRAELERVAKQALLQVPGVYGAVTRSEVLAGRLPGGLLGEQISNTYFEGRSGDLIVIPRPFFIKPSEAANHLTGYSYDRTVPLLLFGRGIHPGRISQRAEVRDLAPTLAYLLGILPPAMSDGRVLSEALR